MIQVQFRYPGDGVWRSFMLPAALPAALTLAKAAKTLQQPQAVQLQPSGQGPALDLRA
jgi:hypothetical protein